MTPEDEDLDFAAEFGVLVSNDRGCKQLAWLVNISGRDAVIQAVACLAGKRRPYPTNLARILGVQLPDFEADAEAEDSAARERAPVAPIAQDIAKPSQITEDVMEFARLRAAENAAAAARHAEYQRLENEAASVAMRVKLDALRARKGLPPRTRT